LQWLQYPNQINSNNMKNVRNRGILGAKEQYTQTTELSQTLCTNKVIGTYRLVQIM
jgi:hypothetical protein